MSPVGNFTLFLLLVSFIDSACKFYWLIGMVRLAKSVIMSNQFEIWTPSNYSKAPLYIKILN